MLYLPGTAVAQEPAPAAGTSHPSPSEGPGRGHQPRGLGAAVMPGSGGLPQSPTTAAAVMVDVGQGVHSRVQGKADG